MFHGNTNHSPLLQKQKPIHFQLELTRPIFLDVDGGFVVPAAELPDITSHGLIVYTTIYRTTTTAFVTLTRKSVHTIHSCVFFLRQRSILPFSDTDEEESSQ
jgi:hypothetical protein